MKIVVILLEHVQKPIESNPIRFVCSDCDFLVMGKTLLTDLAVERSDDSSSKFVRHDVKLGTTDWQARC